LRKKVTLSLLAAAALGIGGPAAVVQTSLAQDQRASSGKVKVATRRITESQYRHAIRDVFGAGIQINSRFEPERREDGLLAVGVNKMSITSSGFEQYFALAQNISDQVLAPDKRAQIAPCAPSDLSKSDDACTAKLVALYGEQLFRRPLTDAEVKARVVGAAESVKRSGDFYVGLRSALTSLLLAPEFLFRVELAEADPAKSGAWRLDGYTKAARLSFLFWDAPPDAELLAAAKDGSIHTTEGLKKQLGRLAASPRTQEGARAFFADMLQLDQFDNVTKDTTTYPKFRQIVADSAKEETLKTIVDLLVTRHGDYRDIFTSNLTFINRPLASIYQVPYLSAEAWAPYTFPAASERSGILTQVTFLSLFSHPAASSPTKRGVKMNEIFLCQKVPDPPPNVDFSKVQAVNVGTVRTRLLAHMENPVCAGCHRISDPPGLALEHFDGIGQLRTRENGAEIDVLVDLDGEKVLGAQGIGKLMHDDPRSPACLVRNVYAYGVGRAIEDQDEDYLHDQAKVFAGEGYKFVALMVQIASTPEFFKASILRGALRAQPAKVAVVPSTGAVQ
jgi:hypothetical protein